MKQYAYPSYAFSNMSNDVMGILKDACDQLDIAWRRPKFRSVWTSRGGAVAAMDSFVGPKS